MSLRHTLQLALAIVVATVALALGTAAGAVDNPDYTAPPPSVLTNVAVKKPAAAPVVQTANSSSLPITGAETMQLVVIGGVLLAGGFATMAIRRRTI